MSLCPQCGAWESKTLETRKDTRFNWRWRRRRCLDCSTIFETYEIPTTALEETDPINPNGKLER
jgi:transcriptional regulator NrdR family protein